MAMDNLGGYHSNFRRRILAGILIGWASKKIVKLFAIMAGSYCGMSAGFVIGFMKG
ncbi:MAG TPA: hypothetical protein VKA95_17000 [Nitrososphaeraceae archaeon]|nr:hypothetical protein [Nitrososphaeraceae archaeon]